tara:strand:- start:343 stop:720 length:378 start_codon:yes stop_codon:yes gene_type:complete
MKDNVYKILRENEWEKVSITGEIITDIDKQDGFIHLSTAFQLAATLSFFFQDSETVYLLEIDLQKIDTSSLFFEDAYPNGGKRKSTFPHLYSALTTEHIANVWTLKRNAFDLPEEVLLQGENFSK